MLPAGFCTLHHSPLRTMDGFVGATMRFVREIQAELNDMHDHGWAHGDVKPSNMVCVHHAGPERLVNMRAMLIDFEHCIEFSNACTTLFSGTQRYASVRMLNLSRVSSSSCVDEFCYGPADDFESLFYSALELLSLEQRLPWTHKDDIQESIALRVQVLTNDAYWAALLLDTVHSDAHEFLNAARNAIARKPAVAPFPL